MNAQHWPTPRLHRGETEIEEQLRSKQQPVN
jgi:hypothetical protein